MGLETDGKVIAIVANNAASAAANAVPVADKTAQTALAAIAAAVAAANGITVVQAPKLLKEEVITLPTASATVASLLAGGAFQAGVHVVTFLPLADIGLNNGAAAVITSPAHAAGVSHETGYNTDMRIIGASAAACRVTQEG